MHLIAWRNTGKNPCDDPPVHITIAPLEKNTWVFPWVLPLERAIEMFGKEVVDEIGEGPIPIRLELITKEI